MAGAVVCTAALGLVACSSGATGTGGPGGAGATSTSSTGATSTTGTGATGTTGTGGSGGATSTGGTGGSTSGDTWANYANGFFTTYCVECHSPSTDPTRDFTQYAMVKSNAPTIRCGVAPTSLSSCSGSPPPKQFPISDAAGTNPKPTDAERDRIVAWIEAGLPQ